MTRVDPMFGEESPTAIAPPRTVTISTERRQKGFFGWFFAILFWLWQAICTALVMVGLSAPSVAPGSGAALAADLFFVGLVSAAWLPGTVILGTLMLLTRGKKIVTTRTLH